MGMAHTGFMRLVKKDGNILPDIVAVWLLNVFPSMLYWYLDYPHNNLSICTCSCELCIYGHINIITKLN